MTRKLYVLIAVDVDPDRRTFGGCDAKRGKLVWRGVTIGIPSLINQLKNYEKKFNQKVNVTFFLRADKQIESLYGKSSWLFEKYNTLWRNLIAEGHEIGWHPHSWRWNKPHQSWCQELKDMGWLLDCISNAFKSLPAEYDVKSTRMGWGYHSNITMNALKRFGIEVDLSAEPNVYEKHFINGNPNLPVATRNWLGTPEEPYFPAEDNYKKPANSGMMLEIPVSTFELPFHLKVIKKLKNLTKELPCMYAIPYITRTPILFRIALKNALVKNRHFFVVVCHADELISEKGYYSISNFMNNLTLIEKMSSRYNISVTYLTARQVFSMYALK